jgi:hypothetical protein
LKQKLQWQKIKKLLLLSNTTLLCLLLSSCTKQQSSHRTKSGAQVSESDNAQYGINDIVHKEAMLVDIPIPLYDERIILPSSVMTEGGTLVFGYKSPLSRDKVIDFFMTQMERLGWKHLVTFEGAELILQFESPDRYCTVVVKNISSSHSSIFIYLKKASAEACLS